MSNLPLIAFKQKMRRDYYSVRTGKLNVSPEINLVLLKKLFLAIYTKLEEDGYFQKYFGYWCVDAGDVKGELGSDIEAQIFFHLKKENLYPIGKYLEQYTEDDLFDIIEFFHDYTSAPIEGNFHSYNGCGWHYYKFDNIQGQKKFRDEINYILKDYQSGYEISKEGEILTLPENGLGTLFIADVPSKDVSNVKHRVERAVLKFRLHKSSWDDRRDAIRELADVLEYLRIEAKQHLIKEDEADLFNLANNYGIRHHNVKQKTSYDPKIWYPWMFYYYLSTIHALLRFIESKQNL